MPHTLPPGRPPPPPRPPVEVRQRGMWGLHEVTRGHRLLGIVPSAVGLPTWQVLSRHAVTQV